MTGNSSRENPRSSKIDQSVFSSEPTAFRGATKQSNPAAPVLFRLPSIPGSPAATGTYASAQMAGSLAIPMGPASPVNSTISTPNNQAPRPLAALTMQSADASHTVVSRGVIGRLFQFGIVVLLLLALAILSFIALRPHFTAPEIAADQSQAVPPPLVFLPESAESSVASTSNAIQSAGTVSSAPADGLLSGLEINEPAKPVTSRAQVQLGLPIPVKASSKGLAASAAGDSAATSSLPLSTPRYETVSSPGSPSETPAIPTSTSPSLWDGAQKTNDSDLTDAAGGVQSLSKEKTESPDSLAGTGAVMPALPRPVPTGSLSSELKLPTASRDSSTVVAAPALLDPATLPTRLASPTPGASSGVSVGGDLTAPETLAKTTATPDLDAAEISKKFLDYVQRKSTSAGSGAPATVSVRPSVTTSTPGMTAPSTTTSAPAMSATQPTASVTPYVRSAPAGTASPTGSASVNSDAVALPSASPTMPTSNPASSSAPLGLIGGNGYATAPSGDVAPPIPVMGRIGVSSAAPPTGVQSPAGTTAGSTGKP